MPWWRHDTQHNDTKHNDTRHNNKNAAFSVMALENDVMVSVAKKDEYGEYRYAECCGAAVAASTIKMFRNLQINPISWSVTLH
jgi:hypothetical protein